jgi:hypothetical protein
MKKTITSTKTLGWLPAKQTTATYDNRQKHHTQSAPYRILAGVSANIHLTLSKDGETVTKLDWLALSGSDRVNIISATYKSEEFDSMFGIWVKSYMPGEDTVTFDVLKALEGERADLVIKSDGNNGLTVLNVLPPGKLTDV